MTTSTITKIQNGTIVLPKSLRKTWQKGDVFIFPSQDTLIVKKVQKSLSRLSDLASRVSSPKMTQKEIQKEIQDYRKTK